MRIIENQTFDMERSLYGSRNIKIKNCAFDGPADGESALKECENVAVENCFMNLRYPFWHDDGLEIAQTEMTENCRASIWYSQHIQITDSKLHGIKALRECRDVSIRGCDIVSPEFGWSVSGIRMEDTHAVSEYFMMRAENLVFKGVTFRGKYSFQYIKNAVFENCTFDTKDAFWHGENILVRNSTIKGEYLAWYSNGLTLENCRIIGTQPLCYCKNLKLINCEMIDTDLCFEKSDVQATLISPIVSIKNPRSGKIYVPGAGKVIRDDASALGEVIVCSPMYTGANACCKASQSCLGLAGA